MEIFFTPEQMQWVRDHAELMSVLSTILLFALIHVAVRAAERRHPGTVESILRDWTHL